MPAKTEAATPRRIRRARDAGDIPLSNVLVAAVALGTGLLLSPLLLERARAVLPDLLRHAYREPESIAFVEQATRSLVLLLLPWLCGVAAIAALATLVQTRAVVRSRQAFASTAGGRIFDAQRSLATLLGALGALTIGAAALILLCQYPRSIASSLQNPRALPPLLEYLVRRLFWWALGIGLSLGLVDLWLAHRFWRERLRMTRAELHQEQREAGTDPERRARLAEWRRELSILGPLESIGGATLIVHDEDRLAVLLRYDDALDEAPVMLAFAYDEIAERVIAEAHHRGLSLYDNPTLARHLTLCMPGSLIPESTYDEVARVLKRDSR
jgi:flagellar biosynthetic protein FlhB